MIKKVKFFITIIILTAFALTFLIVSAASFAGALKVLKSGSVVGGFAILILFVFALAISALLALIDLPFTVISIKKSESKTFPIIALSIETLILIIGIIFLILVLINKK